MSSKLQSDRQVPIKYYREWSELFVAGLPLLEEAPRDVRDAARPDSAQAAARMLGLTLSGGATDAAATAGTGAGAGAADSSAGAPDAERPVDKDGLLDETDFNEYKACRCHAFIATNNFSSPRIDQLTPI